MNDQGVIIAPALGDNLIYGVPCGGGKVVVVDPGDAGVVRGRWGAGAGYVLVTHHHADHTGGIGVLKKWTGCLIIGPDGRRITGLDTVVKDGDTLELGDLCIRCIGTPGHTATSVCYYVTGQTLDAPLLFTGDTLFVCGCGRVFEADMQTMFNSLRKLAALPDETLVFPGHDYTEENVRFALTAESDNEQLKEKLNEIHRLMRQKRPTVPSTIGEEKRLNPFMRAGTWREFAELRKRKDVF